MALKVSRVDPESVQEHRKWEYTLEKREHVVRFKRDQSQAPNRPSNRNRKSVGLWLFKDTHSFSRSSSPSKRFG